MQEQELQALLLRLKNGTASQEDKAFLESWYLQQAGQNTNKYPTAAELAADADEIWASLKLVARKKEPVILWQRIVAAASIIVFLGLGYFFYRSQHVFHAKNQFVTSRIRPGGDKATLILGNGAKVILNEVKNGEVGNQGNVQIIKLSNGQVVYHKGGNEFSESAPLTNTMTTPRGGQYHMTLPDGTQAWLNAASSITYPTYFSGNQRRVKITGEVYFEVAKNKMMPFYVESGTQTVMVLGTHFNVNSYPDENVIKTTLLEGSVQVFAGDQKFKSVMIKPGEQSRLTNTGFMVEPVDVDDEVAWKDGIISFNNTDLQGIMRQIGRWYDVEIRYQPNLPERTFTGEISRKAELTEVLKILKMSKINFAIDHRTITVSP